jgi:hypothetical protein
MMKKAITILIFISLISCQNDELKNESKTAQTETEEISVKSLDLPEGCPYSYDTYTTENADFIVYNVAELKTAITNSINGNIIYLDDNSDFIPAESDLPIIIDTSIKIVSNRGLKGSEGAKLYSSFSSNTTMFKVEADEVTFSGVRIIGHSTEVLPAVGETIGIDINNHDKLTVENCEISGWFLAGIRINNSKENKVIINYIH